MRRIALIVLLFWTGVAYADHDGILVIAKSGYYVLHQDATGVPVLMPAAQHFKQVIILDEPGPSPPTPGPISARAAAFRDAAAKATADVNRVQTSVMLAEFYKALAVKVRSGELKGRDVIAFAIQIGHQQFGVGSSPAWKGLRDEFTLNFTKAAQEGYTDAQYAGLLDDAAAGVAASINRSEMQALDLRQILALIQIIIDMILKLLPAIQPNEMRGLLQP